MLNSQEKLLNKSTRTVYDSDNRPDCQDFLLEPVSRDLRQSKVPAASPFSKLSKSPLNVVLETNATCLESRSLIMAFHSPSSQKIMRDDVSLASFVSSQTTSVRYAARVGQLFVKELSSATGSVLALSLVATVRRNCDEIAICHLSNLSGQYPEPLNTGLPLSMLARQYGQSTGQYCLL